MALPLLILAFILLVMAFISHMLWTHGQEFTHSALIPATFEKIPYPTTEEKKEWKAEWLQYDWDREKYEKQIPTNTVVIHHTASAPGMTWQKLSEIQYARIYTARYHLADKDPYVKGLTPQSGHFRYDDNGKLVQVYYVYHAIVRQNGNVEPLLNTTEVGWHCGNWSENMRSLAIVIDGDFQKGTTPSDQALKAVAKQILEWKKQLQIKYLKAHKEVSRTVCPGPWWDTKGIDGKTGCQKLAEFTGLQIKR